MGANTDRMLAMIDAAVAGSGAVSARPPRGVPGIRARGAGLPHRRRSCATSSPCRFPTSTPTGSHAKAREHDIYIQSGSMIEVDPRWPGVVFNTTCLIGPGGDSLQVPQGESVDPVRGPRQPARPRGLRRAAVPGGGHADRPDRLRDLLRLAVSRSDPAARGQRRRGAHARLGLHGSVGRDRADELVDARQPLPRPRKLRLRRRRQPGRQPASTIRRTRGLAAVR